MRMGAAGRNHDDGGSGGPGLGWTRRTGMRMRAAGRDEDAISRRDEDGSGGPG